MIQNDPSKREPARMTRPSIFRWCIRLASFDAGKKLIVDAEEAYGELQMECASQCQSTAC
eukprot:1186641-Prorocentrum_minimum.AAC.8